MTTQQTGATPRNLDRQELHSELRRADEIINHAWQIMNIDNRAKLVHHLSIHAITEPTDPVAQCSRYQALNRISPAINWLQLVMLALLIFITACYAYAQSENQYLKTQLTYQQLKQQ